MTEKNEIAETRRARLLSWMEKNKVSRTDLATKLDVGRAYVSLLFKPDRFFGEKAARSMEEKLYMPKGYLDGEEGGMQTVDAWESPGDLPDGVYALVPRVSIKLSAGSGVMATEEQDLPPLAFRKDWLAKKNVSSRKNLRIAEVEGDSMEDYLAAGDIVLLDMGQQTVVDSEVYAIRYGDELRIKRLSKRFDGGLIIRSDNAAYREEALSPSELKGNVQVLGRLIWRGG